MPLKLSLDDLDQIAAIHAPHLVSPPGLAPAVPQFGGPTIAPGTLPVGAPPTRIQRPTRQDSNAAGKAEFQAGKPTVTAQPGTSGYFGQRIAAEDYDKAHPWGSPISEHPGFLGKVGHVFAKAGNIAGDTLAPGAMENIPGTDLNKQVTRASDESRFAQAQQQETAKEGVEQKPEIAEATGEMRGRQQAEREAAQEKRQGETEAERDKRLQQTLDSQETRSAQRDAESDKKQAAQFGESEKLQGQRESAADRRLDKTLAATGTKRSAAESAQVERESRGAIRKAEGDFNNANAVANEQRQFIQEAKGGNKEAVKMVPLEGALEITTAQGVHRINRTEVEQYGQAGSLFDRIKAAIGKGVSGKDIPDNILADMDKLTREVQHNAYKKYKDEYDYENSVVKGYGGEGFENRVPLRPGPDEQNNGAAAAGGIQVIRDANGRIVGVK